MTNLLNLTCCSNNLTELPTKFNCIHLRKLFCANNKLTELSEIFDKLINLYLLDLSHNNLIKLPTSLGNCIDLIEFNCSFNKLEELPLSIVELKKLEIMAYDINMQLPVILQQFVKEIYDRPDTKYDSEREYDNYHCGNPFKTY